MLDIETTVNKQSSLTKFIFLTITTFVEAKNIKDMQPFSLVTSIFLVVQKNCLSNASLFSNC